MHSIINYQMSVFGDYSPIEPTLERMNILANVPPELGINLLPSTANVISLPTNAQQGEIAPPQVIQRISMADKRKCWNIAVLPERIDVNYFQQKTDEPEDFENISAKASSLMRHTTDNLSINYWRLAINFQMLFDDENDNKTSALFGSFSKPMQHQIGKECIEWQISSNYPHDAEIAKNHKEALNVISVISKQFHPITAWPVVIAQLDINTTAHNREYRFDDAKLEAFNETALGIANVFIGDMKEKWTNA